MRTKWNRIGYILIVGWILCYVGCQNSSLAKNDDSTQEKETSVRHQSPDNSSLPEDGVVRLKDRIDPGQDKQVSDAGASTESNGGDQPAETTSPLDDALAAAEKQRQESEDQVAEEELAASGPPAEPVHESLLPLIQEDWTRLHEVHQVWMDQENNRVIVAGRICARVGPLEMFACTQYTKEHESVVATISDALIVHTGLLAVGAIHGKPVQWEPEFVAATGPIINIDVWWMEDEEKQTRSAKEMVYDRVQDQTFDHDWVFCGSVFWDDPDTGESHYLANGGELVCVSNFNTATMDLNIESSNLDAGLLFESHTENIPPQGTPVLLVLTPDLETNPDAE